MTEDDIKDLFKRYQEGNCTVEERDVLESWYLQYHSKTESLRTEQIEEFGKEILAQLPAKNPHRHFKMPWRLLTAATLALFAVGFSIYLLKPNRPITKNFAYHIKPGSNKAILTLANGLKVNLNDVRNGFITKQDGITIEKATNGLVQYKQHGKFASVALNQLNTVSTPNGGQWQINLPDGTHVWLNSASSLTYPISFDRLPNRKVKITGEAYFEVAKDKSHPFIVEAGNQFVKVLGTHFNINSYPNEPTLKTTLIEGSVQISTTQKEVILKPGEQAKVSKGKISIAKIDTEPVIAWKDGDFIFKDIDFKTTMRQISRWYDVEVIYKTEPVSFTPGGWVSRSKDINTVLKIMESTEHVHFKVDGRRIVVTQ
ncbi:FecR family protein [Mucilaginibacter terrae]|uniref:Transmembrane sensor n=1 Tax=Mucilaginibacter terrae TaxID=1955052 RepID=A0ABU3GQ11_9SPHI|nr:FecR family protein [Mucilaginibacter terrae]MDT3401047.1 transmembrane sensor [Mucilaginibacter terrae]